jgi:hypothetical protein
MSVWAETPLDRLCTDFPANSKCEGYVPPAVPDEDTVSSEIDPKTGLPLVALEEESWQTDNSIPWSRLVVVNDEFDERTYLAVFDKNFQGSTYMGGEETGVKTLWSKKFIGVYAYQSLARQCSIFACSGETEAFKTTGLEVKVAERIFPLKGSEGQYPVPPKLKEALRTAQAGQLTIRVTFDGGQGTSTNVIGEESVLALRRLYGKTSS